MARWFATVLVLQSHVGSGWDDESLLDHQIRLIEAKNPEAAYDQALHLGKQAEHDYQNVEGEVVQWRFLGLKDLVELDAAPTSGAEVYTWRVAPSDDPPTVAKEQLTVFWLASKGKKRASDLLD